MCVTLTEQHIVEVLHDSLVRTQKGPDAEDLAEQGERALQHRRLVLRLERDEPAAPFVGRHEREQVEHVEATQHRPHEVVRVQPRCAHLRTETAVRPRGQEAERQNSSHYFMRKKILRKTFALVEKCNNS